MLSKLQSTYKAFGISRIIGAASLLVLISTAIVLYVHTQDYGRGVTALPLVPTPTPKLEQAKVTVTTPAITEEILVAAGDIASCESNGDEATASLLEGISGTVATLGDNAYNKGTAKEYAECYGPSWGRFKTRTHPAAGNHEYVTTGAAGYFEYFGLAAGDKDKGYYSYNLGKWHIVVLNSNCWAVGGCGKGSPQESWLRADLAASKQQCTLAYWHHPRFSSGGEHGNNVEVAPFWQALYDYQAEVILTGHDHDYERFALLNPEGKSDPLGGIRQFVVGTGGKSHYAFGTTQPGSEVRDNKTYGVLKLTLRDSSYGWDFIPVNGSSFSDSGTSECH